MALKSSDIVDTLIFDEIDSGISGAIAHQVGVTLETLSKSHQILCVTHLSQIAGKGKHHFKVSKKKIHGRTANLVDKLSEYDP